MLVGLDRPRTLFAHSAASLIARPWLDRTVLLSLNRIVFPLSRAWAEAEASGTNPDRFLHGLGRRDVITPFATGRALARQWRLPPDNLFVYDNGHFTVPMRLMRDSAPTRRFAEILRTSPTPRQDRS